MRTIVYLRRINREVYETEKEISLSITFEMHLPKIFKWVHIATASAITRILKEASKNQSNDRFCHNIASIDAEAASGNFKRHIGKLEEFKYKNGYYNSPHPKITTESSTTSSTDANP